VTADLIRAIDCTLRALGELRSKKLPLREERAAEQAETRAKQAAVDAFAALNQWKRAISSSGLGCLGRGLATRSYGWRGDDEDRELFDHAIWFRAGERYVAAIGQPYMAAIDLVEWRDHLAERGFALHVPLDPLASFHFPGSTLFVVVTRVGVPVHFLPEQDGRLRGLWKGAK
jgi:hypothetical protein